MTGLIQGVNFSGLVSYIYFDFTLCTFNHVKVVLEGYHRYFFGVKVKTVKLIGRRIFLAARSDLNVRTYSNDLEAAIYACPNHADDGIHSDHGYLDTFDNHLGPLTFLTLINSHDYVDDI